MPRSELYEKLSQPVAVLDLPPRVHGIFRDYNVETVRDVVIHSRNDLMKYQGFGRGFCDSVAKALRDFDVRLELGMEVGRKTWVEFDEEGKFWHCRCSWAEPQYQQRATWGEVIDWMRGL
jgi:hypothetical protein